MTIGLTGQSFTASQGTAVIPNETVIPSGLSITSEQGTATASSTTEAQLTGISFTASLGTVTIPNDVVQLSGVSAEFSLGSIVGLGGAVVQPSSLSINS